MTGGMGRMSLRIFLHLTQVANLDGTGGQTDGSSAVRNAAFLPRDARIRRGLSRHVVSVCPSIRLSVCLSIRPSRSWILSKRKKTYLQVILVFP